MPELPEVETVRRGLEPTVLGAKIRHVTVRRADLRFPVSPDLGQRLTGATFTALERRSKYLLFSTDRADVLLVHLGMSGRFVLNSAAEGALDPQTRSAPQTALASGPGAGLGGHLKHDHIVMDLEPGHRLVYNDPRRFGSMEILEQTALSSSPRLKDLGPEPLGPDFTQQHLKTCFAKKRSPIKAGLLDQRHVAGLGNIYVCESLYRAGIAPTRACCDLTDQELNRLVPAIQEVLTEAIAAGGSSLKDYVQASGELGYFQHRFAVYGREGQACPGCDCDKRIQKITQSGRSSFYCPKKQI